MVCGRSVHLDGWVRLLFSTSDVPSRNWSLSLGPSPPVRRTIEVRRAGDIGAFLGADTRAREQTR